MTTKSKWIIGGAVVLLLLIVFFYIRYYAVSETGVQSGQLIQLVRRGYIFKTYEGQMILGEIKDWRGVVEQDIFTFSVSDSQVAKRLQLLSGQHVNLHYKKHRNPLIWRGSSVYIVDRIIEAP